MGKIYKNLDVWQKSIELTDSVYFATKDFPKSEIYGLASQMRRCAVSVASNIAEGHERNTTKEFIQFLGVARGSLAELETQTIIASRQEYINKKELEQIDSLCTSINKMLRKLMASLNEKINNESRISNLHSLKQEAK